MPNDSISTIYVSRAINAFIHLRGPTERTYHHIRYTNHKPKPINATQKSISKNHPPLAEPSIHMQMINVASPNIAIARKPKTTPCETTVASGGAPDPGACGVR